MSALSDDTYEPDESDLEPVYHTAEQLFPRLFALVDRDELGFHPPVVPTEDALFGIELGGRALVWSSPPAPLRPRTSMYDSVDTARRVCRRHRNLAVVRPRVEPVWPAYLTADDEEIGRRIERQLAWMDGSGPPEAPGVRG